MMTHSEHSFSFFGQWKKHKFIWICGELSHPWKIAVNMTYWKPNKNNHFHWHFLWYSTLTMLKYKDEPYICLAGKGAKVKQLLLFASNNMMLKIRLISTCPVRQLAEKLTSPSQSYHLSFLIIVKLGHSSGRTSSVKLNSSLPDCWSSRTGLISSPDLS